MMGLKICKQMHYVIYEQSLRVFLLSPPLPERVPEVDQLLKPETCTFIFFLIMLTWYPKKCTILLNMKHSPFVSF